MSKYKHNQVVGESWQNFNSVQISNGNGDHPRIRATKQQIFNMPHGAQTIPAGSLEFPYDPAYEFPIIDTTTGAFIRTSTMAELYQLIYCCLMSKDQDQDAIIAAALIPLPEPEPEPQAS